MASHLGKNKIKFTPDTINKNNNQIGQGSKCKGQTTQEL